MAWIYHVLLTHSFVDGHLGFHFLAIMNSAAVNIWVQDFVQLYIFIFLGYVTRSGIARPLVTAFNFLRNCQTVSHSDYSILHSHQHCKRVFLHGYCAFLRNPWSIKYALKHLKVNLCLFSHHCICNLSLKFLEAFPNLYRVFAFLLSNTLIHLFIQYKLLSVCYVPGSILAPERTEVNRA